MIHLPKLILYTVRVFKSLEISKMNVVGNLLSNRPARQSKSQPDRVGISLLG